MAKVLRSHPRILGIGTLIVVALLALLALTSSAAGGAAEALQNSGVFVGTDDTGNFQLALEDAVAQAAAAAGCCDIRISYQVVETTGQQGGFVFIDEVSVKIAAKW